MAGNIGDIVTWGDGEQTGVIVGFDGPYHAYVDDHPPSTNRALRAYSTLRAVEPNEVRLERAMKRRMKLHQRRTQS
jgi:hypothetical protein